MKPIWFSRSHSVVLTTLFTVLAYVVAWSGDANPETLKKALPLGTVTVDGPATCLSGATKGAACTSVTVSCPGISDLNATLSEAFPTGTVQNGDRTTGFCAQGTSGGGAAITYALAQYGLSDYFDYVVIAAGPGVARMDYGCDKPLYTGPPLNLCPLLTSAPYAYTDGSKVNGWENTTSCATKPVLPSDITKWAADSIVTTTANYSYPQTNMSWFFCATLPVNNSTGQGKFLIDQVIPKNTPDVNCYSGVCKGEAVWQDPNAFSTTHTEMLAQCVGNHQ